jgi:hypothetical protein
VNEIIAAAEPAGTERPRSIDLAWGDPRAARSQVIVIEAPGPEPAVEIEIGP